MKPRSIRAKGANAEREVAALLVHLWPGARRGLGQARSGADVPDVDGSPLWVEVKHRRQVSVFAAIKQAKTAMLKSTRRWLAPVVIHKRQNDREWLTTMPFSLFYGLIGGDMLANKVKETIQKVIEAHTLSILGTPAGLEESSLERYRESIKATTEACFEAVLKARASGISDVMQRLHSAENVDHEMLDQAYEYGKKAEW